MAYPTPINSQITDAVTQSNVKVISESPAQAEGELLSEEEGQDGEVVS